MTSNTINKRRKVTNYEVEFSPLSQASSLTHPSYSPNPNLGTNGLNNAFGRKLFNNDLPKLVMLGKTITTLMTYSRMIQAAALSDHHKFGLEITSVCTGNRNWINTIAQSLRKIKKNYPHSPINLQHLKDFTSSDEEYNVVAAAITSERGVSKGGVVLVAWVVTDEPDNESLKPFRYGSGMYESAVFASFKKSHRK